MSRGPAVLSIDYRPVRTILAQLFEFVSARMLAEEVSKV